MMMTRTYCLVTQLLRNPDVQNLSLELHGFLMRKMKYGQLPHMNHIIQNDVRGVHLRILLQQHGHYHGSYETIRH